MGETPYEVVRSNRKTLALVIDGEARLVVRAPLRMGEDVIRDFIRKKAGWIAAKQRQVLERREGQIAFTLKDGERVLYLGKPYEVLRMDVARVVIEDDFIVVPKGMTLVGFATWMRTQADALIRERVEHYAGLMGVGYTAIKMSNAKKRWGSCSSKNALNFSWRLVMCPRQAIDYVVVHELSHVTHKNHGTAFWARVAAVLPAYRTAQAWLKQNHALMDAIPDSRSRA
jgi:predicted metal-dependent hydrolase